MISHDYFLINYIHAGPGLHLARDTGPIVIAMKHNVALRPQLGTTNDASWSWNVDVKAQLRDARPAYWKVSKKWKIWSVHRCASNFCQDLGESSELTTHTQRVARALGVCSAHTESTCYLTNPTNAQRVAGVRNKWPKHAALHGHALEARWVCAQCALGDRKTSADEHACNV